MIAPWLLIVMALIQLGIAVDLFRTKQFAMSLVFLCYAVSSIGLMLVVIK